MALGIWHWYQGRFFNKLKEVAFSLTGFMSRYASQLAVCMLSILIASVAEALPAQTAADHRPMVCDSKHPDSMTWGIPKTGECAEHSAVLSSKLPGGISKFSRGGEVNVIGFCCRLPADDILTTSHVYVDSLCPPDSVATGSYPRTHPTHPGKLRCTYLNLERYQLGARGRGIAWGVNKKLFQEPRLISHGEIPAGLRYGVGRRSRFGFFDTGCLGFPPGGILVGKEFRYCWGTWYQQLQFRGRLEDPPAGTPVLMVPTCRELGDVYTENPQCIED